MSILNLIPLQDNFWSLHQSEFFDSWRWERNHTWNLNTVMRPTQWIQSLFLTIKIYFFWAEWGHFTRVPLKLLIFKLFWPFVPQILLICESESILIFDRFWGSATCFLTFKVKAFQLSLSDRFWGSARCFLIVKVKAFQLSLSDRFWGSATCFLIFKVKAF